MISEPAGTATGPDTAEKSRRPGGRTARNTAAVLDATLSELGEHGYAGLSVDRVAARSGVHKATVYRRWGGVDGLLAAALEYSADDDWRPPETGSLRGDLAELAREVAEGFTGGGGGAAIASACIAASFQSAAAADALHAFLADRLARCAAVVGAAESRGEVPPGTDGADVVRAAIAPVYYRLFIGREPVSAEDAARYAHAAADSARSGAFAGTDRG